MSGILQLGDCDYCDGAIHPNQWDNRHSYHSHFCPMAFNDDEIIDPDCTCDNPVDVHDFCADAWQIREYGEVRF